MKVPPLLEAALIVTGVQVCAEAIPGEDSTPQVSKKPTNATAVLFIAFSLYARVERLDSKTIVDEVRASPGDAMHSTMAYFCTFQSFRSP